MKLLFLQPAEDEFFDAIDYYNQQSEGLGFDFALEVRTLERILQFPFMEIKTIRDWIDCVNRREWRCL